MYKRQVFGLFGGPIGATVGGLGGAGLGGALGQHYLGLGSGFFGQGGIAAYAGLKAEVSRAIYNSNQALRARLSGYDANAGILDPASIGGAVQSLTGPRSSTVINNYGTFNAPDISLRYTNPSEGADYQGR